VKPDQRVVLVDNTSSEEVAALYPAFLGAGIDVITPNKKAYSSSLKLYDAIIEGSNEGGGRFLNESTVGAGLPIISTLKDLIATGDEVSREKVRSSRCSDSRVGCQNRGRLVWDLELHFQRILDAKWDRAKFFVSRSTSQGEGLHSKHALFIIHASLIRKNRNLIQETTSMVPM